MNRAEYDEAVSKCPNHPHDDGPFRYCSMKGCPWTEEGPLGGFDDEPARWKPRYAVQKSPRIGGTPIPTDEPCLVIRAQDRMAPMMLSTYIERYKTAAPEPDQQVISDCLAHLEELILWQEANPDKVKWADR